MKLILAFLILSGGFFCENISAQSGRVKPAESPTPNLPPLPRVVYTPTGTPPTDKKTQPQTQTDSQTDSKSGLPPPPPLAVEDDGVITVDSALVPIPVSVIDSRGAAVTTLNVSDFLLKIDGQDAEIGDLARSETPVRLALLFDNSSSVFIAREFEKKAAIRFFRQVLRPEKDLAALFSVQTGTRLEQPLTKNISQLVGAIENMPVPAGATALLDGIIKAAQYLSEAEGRRVIVIVSDGVDTISDSTFEQAMKAAQANNCQIYVVKTTDFENFKRTGRRGGNANIRSLEAERRMQEFAAQTGGAVYSPLDEGELNRAFTQISAELSQQYVLSYYPDEERGSGGEFRTISLTVKNGETLTVRTRKGYYVPRNRR